MVGTTPIMTRIKWMYSRPSCRETSRAITVATACVWYNLRYFFSQTVEASSKLRARSWLWTSGFRSLFGDRVHGCSRSATGERDSPGELAAAFTNEALTHLGFHLHASLTLRADDDRGRERLCRYGLRPPFALSRFRVLPDGRISYRVKKSTRRVSRCRVTTHVECISRVCALVPPPRYPLTRFHGALAPRAKL
jgi:hypothetical protein